MRRSSTSVPVLQADSPQTPDTARLTPNRRFALRDILLIPFLVEIFVAVGLTGWLAFRNGQKAVNELAQQLQHELGDRIAQQVDDFLETPTQINALNAESFRSGDLSVDDPEGLERRFWQQIRVHSTVQHIYFGSEARGYYVGAGRVPDTLTIKSSVGFLPGTLRLWEASGSGNRLEVLDTTPDYDPRRRDWYQDAIASGVPGWSEIYSFISDGQLGISATHPVYNYREQLLGVLAVDYELEGVSQFLKALPGTENDTTFIIERSGLLVASSSDEPPFILPEEADAEPERLAATRSTVPAIRLTVAELEKQGYDFNTLARPLQFTYVAEGERQFVRLVPIEGEAGLDWLIAVVVPESDFMAQIHANTRNTIILCLIALAIATLIGVLTSRRLSQTILQLSEAAKEMATGKLEYRLVPSHIRELNTVAMAFNSMSDQLQASFQQLEFQRDSFARFVPMEYLEFLRRDSLAHVQLGEHVSRAMAIFFSDIRSFTSLIEQMHPKDAFWFINAYFGRVSPEIRNHQGFIVKYMGDGIMAAFPNGGKDAVDAAIAQLHRIEEFNQEQSQRGGACIQIGIGIHVGHVMVGILGEANRIQGDAFSDHVNLTSRLEGLTKFYGCAVLISEAVKCGLDDHYQLRFLDRVTVKGRTEAIAIYEVLDAEAPEMRQLKQQTQAEFDRAIAAYQVGDLETAHAAFGQVLAVNERDRAAQLYLERIAILQTQGIPENWQGVWQFQEK